MKSHPGATLTGLLLMLAGSPPAAAQFCDQEDVLEGEPECHVGYVDEHNSGCGSPENPQFLDLVCGESVCGTSGRFPGAGPWPVNDNDWYRITLAEETELHWTIVPEFSALVGIMANGGVDSCDSPGATAFLEAAVVEPGQEAGVTRVMGPGTWYLFVGPNGADTPCGARYRVTIGCAASCQSDCADGGDGVVDATDLMRVLADWGSHDPTCDFDDDATITVDDLLAVLTAWGPCS
jgi:hypothetical protein